MNCKTKAACEAKYFELISAPTFEAAACGEHCRLHNQRRAQSMPDVVSNSQLLTSAHSTNSIQRFGQHDIAENGWLSSCAAECLNTWTEQQMTLKHNGADPHQCVRGLFHNSVPVQFFGVD